jgi:hypothetical protein
MDDPKDSAAVATGEPEAQTREPALRIRFERLRALQSAWGVLAPSGLSGEKNAIAEAGRALSNDLTELSVSGLSGGDETTIPALDKRLDGLETEMREVALKVPVAQLRSTLPERLAVDRRGVLDLLDLILGAEVAALPGTQQRIPVIDYLITLLTTGGDPSAPLQDPVTLTPRLFSLCERSDIEYDPRLPELEAEFYAAVDMHQADVREEVQLRTLRQRKMELGSAFFAPRVLRAIMVYNAALLERIDDEVLNSQDWGMQPSEEVPDDGTSVFKTSVLPKLVEALRRRAAGDPPAHVPLDRVAWCLDLTSLTPPEHKSLLARSTGAPGGLLGTTVLVGLLRRSAVVLDEELPAIGIASSQLSGAWTEELGEALQQQVNRRIAKDDYDGACALTDLKGKFLTAGMARVPRASPIQRPARPPAPREKDARTRAKEIAEEALESLSEEEATLPLRGLPWARIARAGGVGLIAVLALAMVNTIFWDKGRVDRAELAAMSPFLSSGERSDLGTGDAFVGSLGDEWSQLDVDAQATAAETMVQALREQGIREIMVYDDDQRLRIQALGSQPPRVIRASAPR